MGFCLSLCEIMLGKNTVILGFQQWINCEGITVLLVVVCLGMHNGVIGCSLPMNQTCN